ncbi:MAG: hypothetical protein MNSN_11080 [Minisyncoccus archaeiphilus]|uniref:DUF5671 domain-containing protein n=1 Tax=Minisyncoccus archaeiphilus TaxID=3238481 RepID=UPI0009C77614|nr:MAG: hypothetical protein BWY21_01918 [Parcubacteria group bacterium ADurb.Bin216]GMX60081.1 MAG: hypothetical protein MNSN_11080 [Candidatus Parcubacteria bacterium]
MKDENLPKLAFYYCLALVTLAIGSISTGIVLFELIDKFFPLISYEYYGSSGLKGAISGIAIAFPIYYFTTRNIYKGIHSQEFSIGAGPRKWLTYLIILISSIVMIGSLIGLLNNFLDGETSTNFLLKVFSVLGISSLIFGFYFTDIKKREIDNRFNKLYFYSSLALVLVVFISAFLIIESPTEARNKKIDQKTISDLDMINRAVDEFYNDKKVLPVTLKDIEIEKYQYMEFNQFTDPDTGTYYEYKVIDDKKFELCTDFLSSNLDSDNRSYDYYSSWRHDKGYQCISRRVSEWIK